MWGLDMGDGEPSDASGVILLWSWQDPSLPLSLPPRNLRLAMLQTGSFLLPSFVLEVNLDMKSAQDSV